MKSRGIRKVKAKNFIFSFSQWRNCKFGGILGEKTFLENILLLRTSETILTQGFTNSKYPPRSVLHEDSYARKSAGLNNDNSCL